MINNVSPGFIPSTPTVNPAATPSSGATSGTSSASASTSKKAELEFSPGRNSAKDYSAVQQSLAKGKGAVDGTGSPARSSPSPLVLPVSWITPPAHSGRFPPRPASTAVSRPSRWSWWPQPSIKSAMPCRMWPAVPRKPQLQLLTQPNRQSLVTVFWIAL